MNGEATDYLSRFGVTPEPSMSGFEVCASYGCESTVRLGLTDKEQARVREVFTPPSATALEERGRIAAAVGLLESLAGPKAGTENDQRKNDWIKGQPRGQLDCIAEAANTTTYLLMLRQGGLLTFHKVAHPAVRGIMPVSLHSTALVVEIATGREFAVDSWFEPNGQAAYVLPLDVWQDDWDPADD